MLSVKREKAKNMKTLFIGILNLIFIAASSSIVAEPHCPPDNASYNVNQTKLYLPAVAVDNTDILQAQFNLLTAQDSFYFQLTDLSISTGLTATADYRSADQTVTIPSLCLQSTDNNQSGFQVQMQAIPNSQPRQLLLKNLQDSTGSVLYNWSIANNQGAILLTDRNAFDELATTSDVSGLRGVREVKFTMVDLDSEHPVLFFMNSEETPFHYDFIRYVLNHYPNTDYYHGLSQFNDETYFRDDRRYLAGSVIAYDNFRSTDNSQDNGLYALEFWPTDPVPAHLIEQAYYTAIAALPFLPAPLAYHPVGNTHEQKYAAFAEEFAAKNIHTIDTDTLFAQLDSAILNTGEAYGLLKIIHPGDINPGEDTIAVYTYIPNTLGHVGGIITQEPQTPLSHINLKARQNNTPNAYIRNAGTDPAITALIDQWVYYRVSDDGVHIEAASEVDALQWLADQIPNEVTIPESDLSITEPRPLSVLGHSDWKSVGVKAANVAELGKILAAGIAPDGYALPFALYNEFMLLTRCADNITALCNDENSLSLYEYIQQMSADEQFKQNKQVRTQGLEDLRNIIELAEAPQSLIDRIETVRLFWEPDGEPFTQKLRVRSSTNNEDLEGFNGAGLYESFTHKPKEGKLINSIKQVWASLWTERAFEERRLHRIEHLKTYMGVLIHPNYGDEQANGVAVTKNIYNPLWEGFYINAQYGELSITNPEAISTGNGIVNPIPDEFIVTRLAASASDYAWETLFVRHSNIETVYDEPVSTENVLTDSEIDYLRYNLRLIHAHFKNIYHGDDDFAMDIEFKITETADGSRGKLAIKQARPWID